MMGRRINLQIVFVILLRLTRISQCFTYVYFDHLYSYHRSMRHQDFHRVPNFVAVDSSPCPKSTSTSRIYMVGDAKGEYYGESAGSYMVQEFK